MDEAKRVREAIEKLVARFGDNDSALAAALGVSQPTVSGWRSGMSSPGVRNLDDIARHLETTEYRIRKGTIGDLEVCLAYNDAGRWPDKVIARARKLAAEMTDEGRSMSPKSWEDRLDQLAKQQP